MKQYRIFCFIAGFFCCKISPYISANEGND